MTSVRSKLLRVAGPLLAVTLLILALRGMKWAEAAASLRSAHLWYLLAGLGPSIAALWFRAMRWRVLLGAEKTLPRATVLWATGIGYFGNFVLPARAGEFLRSGAIHLKTGLPLAFVLATALTERLIDAAVLVAIVGAGLAGRSHLPAWIRPALTGMAVAAAGGIAALFVLSRVQRSPEGLYHLLRLSPGTRSRVNVVLDDLKLGFRALQHPRPAFAFFGLTAIIWCCDAVGVLLAARAFEIVLPFSGALVYLGALGLSSAIPSVPGYLGVYQFVAATVLPLYGASKTVAVLFSLVSHAMGYAIVIAWGLTGMVRLRLETVATGIVRQKASSPRP